MDSFTTKNSPEQLQKLFPYTDLIQPFYKNVVVLCELYVSTIFPGFNLISQALKTVLRADTAAPLITRHPNIHQTSH